LPRFASQPGMLFYESHCLGRLGGKGREIFVVLKDAEAEDIVVHQNRCSSLNDFILDHRFPTNAIAEL